MKKTIAILTLALIASAANAATCGCKSGTSGGQTAYGHNGGVANAGAHGMAGSSSSGGNSSGLSYFSPWPYEDAVDRFQPWPEQEMRQFQKP